MTLMIISTKENTKLESEKARESISHLKARCTKEGGLTIKCMVVEERNFRLGSAFWCTIKMDTELMHWPAKE